MLKNLWKEAMLEEIVKLPAIRQVYIWIIDENRNIVIVSKDGVKWQMPGGKPDVNETLTETVIRELSEETGIELSEIEAKEICFFGYYDFERIDENEVVADTFQQVRCYIKLNSSRTENLSPNEPEGLDPIKFVKKIGFDEIGNVIDWMPTTKEYEWLSQTRIVS